MSLHVSSTYMSVHLLETTALRGQRGHGVGPLGLELAAG